MSTPLQQTQITPERIMQLGWSYAPVFILEAAVRHRVFDVLDEAPGTVQEVAKATGASARGLTAIMNALVGFNLLSKEKGGKYTLTPESAAFLVRGKPAYRGGMFMHVSDQLLPKWLRLSEIVQTGEPLQAVNQEQTGGEFFQRFVEDIFPNNYPAAQKLASSLEFNGSATLSVLDLAAGSAVWSIALAQKYLNARVTVVDWPEVLPVARKVASRWGVADRFTFVAGDLLAVDFGTGHDVATLGHILHSEGEERSRELLRKTFDALAPGGTIVIAEFLVNEARTEPSGSLVFAVNMLVNTQHGNTYSFEEISLWLGAAGFLNARTLEAPAPSPLILANKP